MAYTGKVALVTGGGSGMGQLAARNWAQGGAQVAILDVNAEGMQQTAGGLAGVHAFQVDITDPAAVRDVVQQVERDIGPIDRIANAAAIMPLGKILDQDIAIIHKLMDINYGGLVNITKAALPAMVERNRGDFISFSSMAGFIPAMLVGAYNASKFAVLAFTEVLYHEHINSAIRFACVCPPPVATPLLKQGYDTVWPKVLDQTPPIEAQEVWNAIEAGLEKGEFMVFPGKGTKFVWRLRRFFPGLVWKNSHKIEGI